VVEVGDRVGRLAGVDRRRADPEVGHRGAMRRCCLAVAIAERILIRAQRSS